MRILTDKQIKDVLKKMALNHMYAVAAIRKAENEGSNQFKGCVDMMTNNVIQSARILAGLKGEEWMVDKILKRTKC
ncbi:hypothetical protein EVA_14914 [gut metagenome]|uniref:Uncharacterized protein n=1 Tax=gut metagenome TaxID=749906 RepID=J9GC53_9ZZZZ